MTKEEELYLWVVCYGRALRECREELKMSQDDLSKRSTVSRPQISKIENGQATPRLFTMFLLAYHLGTTASNIVERAGDFFYDIIDRRGIKAFYDFRYLDEKTKGI